MAVVVPFESPQSASIERLAGLVAADMERVNAAIQRLPETLAKLHELEKRLDELGRS